MRQSGGRFDDATLATLEYPDVIAQIARHASCDPGREHVRALRPLRDRLAAASDLALVGDAATLFTAGADLSFSGAIALEGALDRAALGASLSATDLRDVARSERALAAACALLRAQKAAEGPLYRLAHERVGHDVIVRSIATAIDDDGLVLDGASGELARLRRQQRLAADEIRRRVDDIVRSASTAKMLSEQIVTVRGGRYVVPVRIEFAAQFPGVVHDQSASGATVFVEPMACVEANNRLRALEAAEAAEVQRVLAELSKLVGAEAETIRANGRLLARFDSIGARARWALEKHALAPDLTAEETIRIVRGRHPLLRREAVPLDIDLGADADAVIISGPNMGGKTVVLKTVGLFCVLAYAGIPLPCSPGTAIGSFDRIACVVGDEQSIADDLSSFSAHLSALHDALRHAGPGMLALVDEIGNGTEPGAGAAIAQAFVEAMLAAGARVVVTTHFTQLKIFASAQPRVANASMLFDAETHQPTYVLAMGVPGQSLAFALAKRLGLSPKMIARAEELLGADVQNLERAFESLAEERERLRDLQAAAERERDQLSREVRDLREREAAIELNRSNFERTAREALDRAVREVRDELVSRADRSRRDAMRQSASALANADEAIEKTMREIRQSLGISSSPGVEPAVNAFAVGDRVYVKSFGQPGVIAEVYDRDVLVTMGSVKATVPRRDVSRDPAALPTGSERVAGRLEVDGRPQVDRYTTKGSGEVRPASLDAATSIDVRGMRVDEAVPVVDKALDDATLAGLPTLRIIHGKGTGQLSRGLRDHLRGHPQAQSAEFAHDREGGTGVTVVTLR